MSHRLTTAIRIADSAEAILRKTESFPKVEIEDRDSIGALADMGVEPMLLALSMELALKAWFVFDYDDPGVVKSHNLMKLFEALKPESQERLDQQFKQTVAPGHPSLFFVDYGIGHVLYQHRDAFTDWRYIYEPKHTRFDRGTFLATLEMALAEFRKRYVEVPVAALSSRQKSALRSRG
ncbi:MAG: hypothetical protein EON58_04605 [Alphaproteobacteria bacterium]|nr:MAG: hypothetical protein EON58_04605 [Alphaproteobacteria bacterium]